jgi:hypothetical protein
MPNFPSLGAGGVHHGLHPGNDSGGEMFHQLGVFVNERLTFGAVGDHKLGPRLRLDVSGEPGAPSADYSALAQFLAEHQS